MIVMHLKEYIASKQYDTSKIANPMLKMVAERMNEILVSVGNYLKENGTIKENQLREYIMTRYLLTEQAVNRNINTLKIGKFFDFNTTTQEFSLPKFVIVEQPQRSDDSRATA